MADPLLSSLCRVCNTNPTRYRCPRCDLQTCSLPCSKRHKIWSHCDGIRDPTVYKSRREVLTPAGIDHDFNFISAIERGIERSDKVIIEERGLVDRKDLFGEKKKRPRGRLGPREGYLSRIPRALERCGVIVDKAPKAMTRSIENTTHWGKRSKCLKWQVEWIAEDGTRFLDTISEKSSLAEAYPLILDYRLPKITNLEKKMLKIQRQEASKARLAAEQSPSIPPKELANLVEPLSLDPGVKAAVHYHFYLHKPHTPSSRPRVLIPLDAQAPFGPQLRNRVVLEFPTVYVLLYPPERLPDTFMLEEKERSLGGSSSGKPLWDRVKEMDMDTREEGEVSEDEDEDEDEDDEDMDMDIKEGELA